MNARRTVIGVDFSGAKEAGKAIWIAQGVPTAAGVRIERLESARDRFGARMRDDAIAALRGFIAEDARDAIVGCDFPFSVHKDLIDADSWAQWATGGAFEDAEAFKHDCKTRSKKELRRTTDREASTPFSPYNLRMYRQTYHGCFELLGPLVRDGAACCLPMQGGRDDLPDDTPWLVETCPASLLNDLGERRPYKGSKREHRDARARIATAIEDVGLVEIQDEARDACVAQRGGDALDAVLAAIAARRALDRPEELTCEPGSVYAIEGRVYA